MWAQDWANIYPLVAPQNADPGYDLTAILQARKTDARQMVKYGEGFFTSLGFAPLPKTFWERSLFTKPRDRDVVCHASAWDVDNVNDLRIKMCIDITAEDFTTIHHELGHNFYQRAYNEQPYLFRDSANDGFHEAIGDTIALSITPEYLVRLGLLDKAPDSVEGHRPAALAGARRSRLSAVRAADRPMALEGLLGRDHAGKIQPHLVGAAAQVPGRRAAGAADRRPSSIPGAKYHVAANVPYTRYFLADILQFQFHRALAKIAGCTAPLHRCSIYGNKAAGERLAKMLAIGQSKPWPDALEELTGQRQMDATAILDYFAPLQKWLDEQNKGKPSVGNPSPPRSEKSRLRRPALGSAGCGLDRAPDFSLRSGSRSVSLLPPFGRETSHAASC